MKLSNSNLFYLYYDKYCYIRTYILTVHMHLTWGVIMMLAITHTQLSCPSPVLHVQHVYSSVKPSSVPLTVFVFDGSSVGWVNVKPDDRYKQN